MVRINAAFGVLLLPLYWVAAGGFFRTCLAVPVFSIDLRQQLSPLAR
jgi:hypothetical protein